MDFTLLTSQIRSTDDYFKEKISRTIDRHLTLRNWLIGFYIAEYEQNGEDRATYGASLLQNIADSIDTKGLSYRNLKLFRQFYKSYPQIGQTASAFLEDVNRQTTSAQSIDQKKGLVLPTLLQRINREVRETYHSQEWIPVDKLMANLSFSHFVELMKIDDALKKTFYEIETINGVWSVRELKRQINSLHYERIVAANNPQQMISRLTENADRLSPDQIIKTPYVFDFLGLSDGILGSESALETALINDLKSFILELGHGFCFEAQQKRIVIGGEYFFIDLVFYHRILKCHVLIELKVNEFTHANAGQLNTYINYYKDQEMEPSDNPPVGILLCTNSNEELVKYALGGMDENLFVSQYQTQLPTTERLEQFLKQEKAKL